MECDVDKQQDTPPHLGQRIEDEVLEGLVPPHHDSHQARNPGHHRDKGWTWMCACFDGVWGWGRVWGVWGGERGGGGGGGRAEGAGSGK